MISWLCRLFARLHALFFQSRLDRQLDEELNMHIELLIEENIQRGMNPETARREARLKVGSRDAAKELHRDARAFRFVDDFLQDVRYSMRVLVRNPLFILLAALSLAIGIGADTTVFSVANALLFRRPAGIREPNRLIDISQAKPGRIDVREVSYPQYIDIQERASTLDGVFLYEPMPRPVSLSGRDGAESIFATTVSVNYFEVLGAQPAAGRFFNSNDSTNGRSEPFAVISYSLWQQHFKRDTGAIGQTIRINHEAYAVLGVASEGFQGSSITTPDVWLPVGGTPQDSLRLTMRGVGWALMGGRLKPGATTAQAAAELKAIGTALANDHPNEKRGLELRVADLSPIPGNLVLPVTGIFTLMIAFVSLVLVIACANLAGVLLSRATKRRREIAVRLAIGAGRYRLIRQLLTETLMIFSIGGVAGLLLSRGLTALLISQLPKTGIPFHLSTGLDGRVAAFTLGLSLISAVLCGLAPALQSSKTDVISTLKNDATATTHRSRAQNVFVIAQVAFSIILVVAAGLFIGALRRMISLDLGYDPHNVELATVDLSMAQYGETGRPFIRELDERIRALPGVQESTIAALLPTDAGIRIGLRDVKADSPPPDPDQQPSSVAWNFVGPGYFSTMKIPFLDGRDFDAGDQTESQPVAIVSETAARKLWLGRNAIGQYLPAGVLASEGVNARAALVVGVVRDVRSMGRDARIAPLIYRPLQQQYLPRVTIAARTTPGHRLAGEIRAALFSMNPNLPILTSQTLEEAADANVAGQRGAASVTGGLGLVGLLLASIGVYGVTAYTVAQRTREIGIRMALGAQRSQVTRMVLRQGMSVVGIGSTIGLALAFIASRLLQGSMLNIPPTDVATFAGAAALFIVVGLIACCVPVHRATRIDAMSALRHE
ncbi:MAG TPA: ABC transporter permease [Terriglobia bacterium]|jgi:predicted permease